MLYWRKYLETSRDISNVLRCPETSRLAVNPLVKCTRQSMCPYAFVLLPCWVVYCTLAFCIAWRLVVVFSCSYSLFVYNVLLDDHLMCSPNIECWLSLFCTRIPFWCAIVSHTSNPCTRSQCTLGVPVPLMLHCISEACGDNWSVRISSRTCADANADCVLLVRAAAALCPLHTSVIGWTAKLPKKQLVLQSLATIHCWICPRPKRSRFAIRPVQGHTSHDV